MQQPLKNHLHQQFTQDRSQCKYPPGLYFVGTPIGNLEDITHRALYTLTIVDEIYCEDTRHSRLLLQHYGIQKPLHAFHDHSSEKVLSDILTKLQAGNRLAYICDAGMPLISDPGYRLVQLCQNNNIYMTVIPGPSAVPAALVLAGLPSTSFYFGGFLPDKISQKQKILAELKDLNTTAIFFVGASQVLKSLACIQEVLQNPPMAVVREITKRFEETVRGTAAEIHDHFAPTEVRGEFVFLIQVSRDQTFSEASLMAELATLIQTHSLKDAATILAQKYPLSRHDIYQRGLTLKP